MDRLFSHQIFAILVLATVLLGILPPVMEHWSRCQQEAAELRALTKVGETKTGALPTKWFVTHTKEEVVAGLVVVVFLAVGLLVWCIGACRRKKRTAWKRFGGGQF